MMNRLLAPWRALRQRYWASLLFDVFLILTVFWCIHAWQTRGLPGAGELPRLSATELDGDRTPQALPVAGKGVVYFFAPWCFYCKRSIGNIDELVRSGKVEWARAVALDFADLQEVRDFVSEVGLEQPVLLGDAETARDWNIRVFPTYFIVDEDGGISSRSVGYSTSLGLKTRALLAR